MKIRRLRIRIVVSFFVVIAVFAFSVAVLGFYVVKKDIIERAQAKVKNDLNSAREIYRQETENVRDAVRFTAVRFFIKDAIAENDTGILAQQLELIRKTESLDILTLTDKDGKVIVRARNSAVFGDSRLTDKLVGRVLSDKKTVAGTVIVSRDELAKEGDDLAERAYIKFIPTTKAKPRIETEQVSGMMIKAASPVFGRDDEVIGVLYGGTLLNRNYHIVDKVKGIVYQGTQYEGKDLGTVTLFQQDVRISTNVRAANGNRAIGTRVSEQVYERVLEKGMPWIDRAFVVTEWYKTSYEPIRDIDGKVIGILYVGTLERPFIDMARNIFLLFLGIVLVATLLAGILALVLSHNLSRPLTGMLKATEQLSEGDLGYKVNTDTGTKEINTLAASFNDMSAQLEERQRSLSIANQQLAALNKTYLDLVGFVSHELKGVLGSAIVSVYSLRDGFSGSINSKQRKVLELITKNLDYLAGVVRKFLNLGRIEKGELKTNKTLIQLREEVFEPALETFAKDLTEKKIEVVNNIPPDLKINCDLDLMHIVANNLVGNAVKYSFDNGRLLLGAEDLNDKFRVEIYNDSRPISNSEKSKIFQKFSRLDNPESKAVKGTGLGLFITKEIINKHGGDIWVEPRHNGNSFVFEIEKESQNL